MNKKNIKFITVVLITLLSGSLMAGDDASKLNGYTFTVGVAAKQLNFSYLTENNITPTVVSTDGSYYTYFLRAKFPYVLSKSRKWGYYFETEISDFSTSIQEVDYEDKNIGTSVNGKYWYVMPIAFYLSGPVPGNKKELSYLTGAGMGVGYLNAKGEMILIQDDSIGFSEVDIYAFNERHKVNVGGLTLAMTLFFEAHYGNWVSRVHGSSLDLDPYSLNDFTWDLGYSHRF